MNLNQWCDRSEKIGVELGKQYFNMEVGLSYSKEKIEELENQSLNHAKVFLDNFKEPKILYEESVGAIAGAKTFKISLRLKELREKKFTAKVNNQTVSWNTWRQFVVTAKDNERKIVFDKLIEKVPVITPHIKKRFDISIKTLNDYDLKPLSSFSYETRISINNLKKTIEHLKSLFKTRFQKEFKYYTNKFLSRDPAYYDDMYFMRNIIYEDLVEDFHHINPVSEMLKVFDSMKLDHSRIKLDKADRKGKFPSPFCSFIKIPDDIRVSYKKENPINDTISIFHEYGHAIHASNIKKDLEYWKKYTMSNALAETFSTYFENLISNKLFLTKQFNLSEDTAEEIVRRIDFIQLYAIMFYSANSLFKIKFWEKNLDFEQADKEYNKQLKECLNLNVPGEYWQLHHILPESLLYVPAYLLAMIKAQEIEDDMIERYNYDWWNNPKSNEYMLKIIQDGTESPINDFNNLNPRLLKRKYS